MADTKPSLADLLASAEGRGRPGPVCKVRGLLTALEAGDPSDFAAMHKSLWQRDNLDRFRLSSKNLEAILGELGYKVSHWIIDRHRRQDCACPSDPTWERYGPPQ